MLGVDDSTLNLIGAKLHSAATAARQVGASGRSNAPGSLSMAEIQSQTAGYAQVSAPAPLHDQRKPKTPQAVPAMSVPASSTAAPMAKKPKASDSSDSRMSGAAVSGETRQEKFAREERERQAELDANKVAVDRHLSMMRATTTAANDLAAADLSAFNQPVEQPSLFRRALGAAGVEVPKEDRAQYRAAAQAFQASVGDGQNADTNAHAASTFIANAPKSTWLSTAGKVLGTILLCMIGVAAGFALGAIVGGGIGALAGAPGGPFAVFTAAFGVLAGAGIGAITLGTALGMAGAGVTAAGGLVGAGFLSKFCFFSNKETPAAGGYEPVPAATHPHFA